MCLLWILQPVGDGPGRAIGHWLGLSVSPPLESNEKRLHMDQESGDFVDSPSCAAFLLHLLHVCLLC